MDCTGKALTAANFQSVSSSPLLAGGTFSESSLVPVEPRPACGGAAYTGTIDPAPFNDAFYDAVTYKGAFGTTNWLAGAHEAPRIPWLWHPCGALAMSGSPLCMRATIGVCVAAASRGRLVDHEPGGPAWLRVHLVHVPVGRRREEPVRRHLF